MNDHLAYYERAVDKLIELVSKDHPKYEELLVLEARLRENIRATRLLSDDQNSEVQRHKILILLNVLTQEVLDVSFNDLCKACEPSSKIPAHLVRQSSNVPYLVSKFINEMTGSAQHALSLLIRRERIWPINCQRITATLQQNRDLLQTINMLSIDTEYHPLTVNLYYIGELLDTVIHLVQNFESICQRQSKQALTTREAICDHLHELIDCIGSINQRHHLNSMFHSST